MRHEILFCLLLTVSVGFASSDLASVPTKHSQAVAILDFEGNVLQPYENQALSERFRSEMLATGVYQVMERSQMDVILKEQGF